MTDQKEKNSSNTLNTLLSRKKPQENRKPRLWVYLPLKRPLFSNFVDDMDLLN